MTTQEIIEGAKVAAGIAASDILATDKSNSNGSEAWQAVKIETKNLRKLQNELKKIGIEKDYYYGYVISPVDCDLFLNNYFAEEAWTNEFSRVLNENGIKARRIERLL